MSTKQYHLGVNLGHDRSAALVRDGEIKVAVHQERLDRKKHSVGFMLQSLGDPGQIQLPHESIQYCLDTEGIKLEDCESITANMPGKDFSLDILTSQLPRSLHSRCSPLISHHLAHAYSAYWPSGFDEALVLAVDATGTSNNNETESYTVYQAKNDDITLLHAEKCLSPTCEYGTLGFLYEQVTRLAGFVTNVSSAISVPEAGKLMGLAPFGKPQVNWTTWLNPIPNSYSIQISPYDVALEIEALKLHYQREGQSNHFSSWIVDLAYKIQTELEQALTHIVSHGLKQTGLKKVCIAGGVGLNSVANNEIAKKLKLDDIFVFPAAGDAGIAAGCAYYAYEQTQKKRNKPSLRPKLTRADLGKTYTNSDIFAALKKYDDDIIFDELSEQEIEDKSAQALVDGLIVARFDGGSEFGPRALGSRSIMADPSFKGIKDIINARVKGRERFRPFAPVIPLELADEVFDQNLASPFMLLIASIKEEYREQIASVTHVDGTGRFQTVTEEDNPFFYKMCHRIKTLRNGPPVILNTSYNLAGEPIVESPVDALKSFCATDIDYLAIGNYWVCKKVGATSYKNKLSLIQNEDLPSGLPENEPAVLPIMRMLDEALFEADKQSILFDRDYLNALASKVSHLKPSSEMFYSENYSSALLNPKVYAFVNPLGKTYFVNLQTGKKSSSYLKNDTEIIFSLASNPEKLPALRVKNACTTREWECKLECLSQELKPVISLSVPNSNYNFTKAKKRKIAHQKNIFDDYASESFASSKELSDFFNVLQDHHYSEETICKRLGIDSLQNIEPTNLYFYDQFLLQNCPIDDLIRLFLLQGSMDKDRLITLFGSPVFDLLVELGVVVQADGLWCSQVDVFSIRELYIVTDHRYILEKNQRAESPVMYLGLDSVGLANLAPHAACDRALDLCTGSGVQALCASRYAQTVIGVDINPRAIRFARFNADLNGIRNVSFVLGDLYKPVSGKLFDTILANPPFVPSPDKSLAFRDGGSSGESILSTIVNQADEHLTDRGQLYIVTDLVDVDHYRSKLLAWWGGSLVHTLLLHTADRDELLFSVPHCHKPFGQSYENYKSSLGQWVNNFLDSGLVSVNFGYILMQKSDQSSYFSRTIYSPTVPIDHHVRRFFDIRHLISKGGYEGRVLLVEPTLRMRYEAGIDGDERGWELLVPDNPYFTTYKVDRDIYQGIQMIAGGHYAYSSFVTESNREWVNDLLLKGVLCLQHSEYTNEEKETVYIERDYLTQKIKTTERIVETETKTTPTCVSSYVGI